MKISINNKSVDKKTIESIYKDLFLSTFILGFFTALGALVLLLEVIKDLI